MTDVNETRLKELVDRVHGDLGGAFSVSLVRIGHEVGLYRTLKEIGPVKADDLADASGCAPRYVREWLSAQAASGYVHHERGLFSLTPEQALVFAEPNSPVNLIGGFDTAAAMVENQPKVQSAFKTGRGVAWGDQAGCMFCAVAKLFRPGYVNALVQDWLPALDGVVDKLKAGATVADVGCGHGLSTILMAQAFPNSRFIGYDFHADSIAAATAHARADGLTNVRFEIGRAQDFDGRDFDLITCFDCLHDMGDPIAAAAHIRKALKEGGTWMVVEPMAGDTLEENINPVGRLYYSASTMICVPTSLAQETGIALGAQAGEKRLAEVIRSGGFTHVRRAAQTPLNMVLEAT
ncbi:class I SAM-dependent methyltransferase (plasmid) [Rhizobium ruizarguesonis]|jgi:2-polyprenyl-3-methyl-5-hydroxy-6-metoxy-1,4-benzoquinol methylase|uniref:Class I SAM-dependent methyltransferase n=2 Tax=Rhizobium leguminosarum TaxID=384 RepID=A0A7M3DJB9_RHILE|nr:MULTISPECIES: class I SAM-dependent methyltransferase [Rhizobium]TAU37093.1 class I SAM-dependent methyltransferase [Rhizobium leguminosarum]TAU59204.1 class I SAM-dependent methyltransferase [Rhizobium ruizarguesonis]TAU93487.1 class I SAM-dependent methyltransferase [Rhizobium leguminosarum]TAV03418.1 class I SAM-dependent methyltransferase [Rhizobium ruizarguesonis]TAV22587.1 class I SAM-dependent methyltransferase [Rhizobium ruizarguesonis]